MYASMYERASEARVQLAEQQQRQHDSVGGDTRQDCLNAYVTSHTTPDSSSVTCFDAKDDVGALVTHTPAQLVPVALSQQA